MKLGVALLVAAMATPVTSASDVAVGGFAFVRGASSATLPFEDEPLTSEVQVGLDWRPSLRFGAHAHLLARDDDQGGRRGLAGIVQAYLEASIPRENDRWRVLAGAFFLPTSRENVDALWENPYTITTSALNSWFGEEFRPIGVDVSWTARQTFQAGLTVFRGNDTFGALPIDRGFAIRDHIALLGEHLPSGPEYFTSVSADTDGRLGWSARAQWTMNGATFVATHIDNRADGTEDGDLLNWNTQFSVVGFDYTRNEWTFAGESGFGVTSVFAGGEWFPSDIRASYLLISRRMGDFRASLRAEDFRGLVSGEAIAAAVFWSPRGRLRTGLEVLHSDERSRVSIEARYNFNFQY